MKKNFKYFLSFLIISLVLLMTQSAYAKRMSVRAPKANVRSGPGVNYEVIWQVEKFYPVNIIEINGTWYLFSDFEGDKGWIHKSYVDDTESVIISREGQNNVRNGPGIKEEVIFQVEKGVPFKVLKREGRWINVEHIDGDKGWVYDTLVW